MVSGHKNEEASFYKEVMQVYTIITHHPISRHVHDACTHNKEAQNKCAYTRYKINELYLIWKLIDCRINQDKEFTFVI